MRPAHTTTHAHTADAPPPPQVVKQLAAQGTKLVAMRCAGFDRVDVEALAEHGIRLVRVPTYSPQSVAEHAVALMFALNRCALGWCLVDGGVGALVGRGGGL